MMRQNTMLTLAMLMGLSSVAQAGVRHYQAGIDASAWQTESSPLSCSLSHDIPSYGGAVFTSEAGAPMNLLFELQMNRLPRQAGEARVMSLAPEWRPGGGARDLGTMRLLRHLDSDLPEDQAWQLLDELEGGMRPTFMFDASSTRRDTVAVSLNSVNFHDQYQAFLGCLDQLLPFSFDDIAYSVLTYGPGNNDLSRESKQRLEMIARYLTHDPVIELVLLDGYSDGYGSRPDNDERARARAESIKSFLVEQGVDSGRITVESHGERRHIASNNTPMGRQLNRRVVIQMRKY